VIDRSHFPDIVRQANYWVDPAAQRQPVDFGQTRPVIPESLRIASPPAAIAMEIKLANRKSVQVRPDGYVVGAWQGKNRLAIAGPAFSERWPGDEDRGPNTS
jgi:hypothetical protein